MDGMGYLEDHPCQVSDEKTHGDRISPKDRATFPFANGRTPWLINGGYYLLTGMILQVRVCRKKPQPTYMNA